MESKPLDEIRHLFDHISEDVENGEAHQQTCRLKTVGYVASIASSITLAASLLCAQALGGVIPVFELNMTRFMAEFLLAIPIICVPKITLIPEKRHRLWLLLRCTMSSLYNVCYYAAAMYLPVGTEGGVFNAMLIVVVSVITIVVYRECAKQFAVAAVVCLLGVIFFTQPDFIFPKTPPIVYNPVCKHPTSVWINMSNMHQSRNLSLEETSRPFETTTSCVDDAVPTGISNAVDRSTITAKDEFIGYSLLLSGSVALAIASFVLNKKIYDMHFLVVTFWNSMIGTVFSACCMLIFETPTVPGATKCILLLIGHGFGAAVSNIFAQLAFQLLLPIIVSTLQTIDSVLLFVAQYTIMKDINPGRGNTYEIIGVVIVITGNLLLPVCELYSHKSKHVGQ